MHGAAIGFMARHGAAVFGKIWQFLAELGRTVQFGTGTDFPLYAFIRSYENPTPKTR